MRAEWHHLLYGKLRQSIVLNWWNTHFLITLRDAFKFNFNLVPKCNLTAYYERLDDEIGWLVVNSFISFLAMCQLISIHLIFYLIVQAYFYNFFYKIQFFADVSISFTFSRFLSLLLTLRLLISWNKANYTAHWRIKLTQPKKTFFPSFVWWVSQSALAWMGRRFRSNFCPVK